MDGLFSYETLKYLTALLIYGEIQSGNKAELIKHLKTPATAISPKVSGAVLEGSILVNMGSQVKIKPSKIIVQRFSGSM